MRYPDLNIEFARLRQGRVSVFVQSKLFPDLKQTTIECGDADAVHMAKSFAARIDRQAKERQEAMRKANQARSARSLSEKAEALFAD